MSLLRPRSKRLDRALQEWTRFKEKDPEAEMLLWVSQNYHRLGYFKPMGLYGGLRLWTEKPQKIDASDTHEKKAPQAASALLSRFRLSAETVKRLTIH